MRAGSEIYLITKGADMVMEPLMTEKITEAYHKKLAEYSQCGLRTLLIAYKKVDRTYFRQWEKEYSEAQNITDNTKEAKVMELQAKLEVGLKLCGITAVEDCLQDGVPQAIATIKAAGVKVWVLTGDKTETAVDIARSCRLFSDGTVLSYAVGATNVEEALEKMRASQKQLQN